MEGDLRVKKVWMQNLFSGAFFIVGILVILCVVFLIGKDKGFVQPKFQVTVLFRDVGGLIEGAPVQLAGVNVGTVSKISFLDREVDGRKVGVVTSIFSKYRKQLRGDVIFSIKTEGILGEKLIEIHSGQGEAALDFSKPLIGQDPLNVQDLAVVFSEAAESFTKTSDDFNEVDVQEMSQVLADTAESLMATSQGINKIVEEMQYISIKSKRMLDRLEQRIIDGDLFKVF